MVDIHYIWQLVIYETPFASRHTQTRRFEDNNVYYYGVLYKDVRIKIGFCWCVEIIHSENCYYGNKLYKVKKGCSVGFR